MFARLLTLALLPPLIGGCGGGPSPSETGIVERCPSAGVSVQALGTGGPEGMPGRAVSTYLLRVDGQPRLLVDAGAGSFVRLHEAGARMKTLDGLLLTRIAPSQVSALPALLEAARRDGRTRPLAVVGPGGAAGRVSTAVWLGKALGVDGPFPEMAELIAPGQPFRLAINEVGIDAGAPRLVYAEAGLEVMAVPVPHGDEPALGYLVTVGERRVAFTGDQRADDPRFMRLIKGADLLVAHLAIAEQAPPALQARYARPSIIGALAKAAGVGRVVLGHMTPKSAPQAGLDAIRARYPGPVEVLADLDCVALSDGQ